MKKMRQFLCCMLVGTMLAASLAGCGGDPGEPKPEGNQTEQNSGTEDTEQDKPEPEDTGTTQEVGNKPEEGGNYAEHMEVIIDNTQIAAINPIGAGGPGSATGWVYKMVYDTLVTWDGEGGYLPCLATSWDTEDWKTITFHLRDDVTFSNGEPLTAYDVEYTIQKALENPGSVAGGQWSAVVSCEALDETTVKLELNAPRPQILFDASQTYAGIMCKSAVESDPDKGVWVGTGTYVITEFASNDYVKLERNDTYWGELPPTKTMTLRYIPEMSTRLMMLQNGEADICFNLSEQDLPLIEEDTENFNLFKYKANNCTDIGFNMNDPVCGDLNFRMAVASALNREDIGIGANGAYAEAETTGTFWGSGEPYRNADIPIIPYDLEKAKEYLADSPYNGEEIELVTAIPTCINASAVIQQQLAEIGIKVKIKQTDPASLMSSCVYGSTDYQMYCFVGAFGFEPYSATYGIFAPQAMQNRTSYDNPEVVAILEKASTETDQAKLQEYYYSIQELVAKDIPYINLFYVLQAIAADKQVGGLVLSNDAGHDLRYMYKTVE
ncbi:MAG: ABC transporter substrate-binding protein [Lachnospiraceae bacterium]|nr:ABC transporter substrate-binding protein [Lachnospiraceae bacterium]MCI9151689.1 ABC transporter substrate-binding protein [Lachnospiraceae bacterium]